MTDHKLHRIHPEIRQRANEMRHPLTAAEEKLWHLLRNRQLGGYKFRRQSPIGPFIVDFYCAETHLIIEIDGGIHDCQTEYDAERTAMLVGQGYTVIRFSNNDVVRDSEAVTHAILNACQQHR